MSKEELIRINKFLSEKGSYSRRGVDKLIEEQRVTVNGKKVKLGLKVNSNDEITVNYKLHDWIQGS